METISFLPRNRPVTVAAKNPEPGLCVGRRKADDDEPDDGQRHRQVWVRMLHRLGASDFKTRTDACNER